MATVWLIGIITEHHCIAITMACLGDVSTATAVNSLCMQSYWWEAYSTYGLCIQYKKLIRRWDSERELFYDDILHILLKVQ